MAQTVTRPVPRVPTHKSNEAGKSAAWDRIEQQYGFDFADDHHAFLSVGLPVGSRSWPDWRNGTPESLREKLAWPIDGVLFDVEHNDYWHSGWGEQPTDRMAAVERARPYLATVPRLVPVFSHRYLPAGRGTFGHPVLSMCQTDIIVYGLNLLDYVYQEFSAGSGIDRSDPQWQPHANGTVLARLPLVTILVAVSAAPHVTSCKHARAVMGILIWPLSARGYT